MPDRASMQSPPVHLLSEALPSLASSVAPFANAPAATRLVKVTLRTAGVTYRSDGAVATAGGNGLDLATGSYEFALSQDGAKAVRMIQSGGAATGWIEYWGV